MRLAPQAAAVLVRLLLPLARVVTPNLPEAAELCGREVRNRADMEDAAARIRDLGPRWVLVKGGHLEGDPIDLLYDGEEFIEFKRERIATRNTHGTGCTYASAIATFLGKGMAVPGAVRAARDAVQAAIKHGLSLGHGHGPVSHAAMFLRGAQE